MEFCSPWGVLGTNSPQIQETNVYICTHTCTMHIDYSNENSGIVCLGNRTQIRDQELGSRWFSRLGCKSHLFTDAEEVCRYSLR